MSVSVLLRQARASPRTCGPGAGRDLLVATPRQCPPPRGGAALAAAPCQCRLSATSPSRAPKALTRALLPPLPPPPATVEGLNG
eukprot:CAMPEP_0118874556 /NCGR_PEP_ID=MMETSP1163-20130328/15955_1 /TAXON_ID=124430 /ORGANISM="Phaeomonas parva, Strain CCMP2877" /LENGTH=83 /DNA_ID=CAMNT_0006809957 /DNA_START=8 /DNA_END=256 /DNA_ORIENTATION=-